MRIHCDIPQFVIGTTGFVVAVRTLEDNGCGVGKVQGQNIVGGALSHPGPWRFALGNGLRSNQGRT
jgi:hypothetical protein